MKNFDALWKEKQPTGAEYHVLGNTYTLPTSIPAKLMLSMMKYEKDKNVDDTIFVELANGLFGKKNVDEWLDNGISIEQIQDIFEWAMEELAPKNTKAPVEKE